MFEPIAGDGNIGRFSLLLMPDGVYSVDGRFVPSANDAALSVNHSKSVVHVGELGDDVVCLQGAVIGMDVEQG